MLGHFTERATSRGRSRSFSGHGSSTVSRNESEQRRALLLPQEFKELGSERLVVIAENCKPILGEKIRYHQEAVFKARLQAPPRIPPMNMALHVARVQQRWREEPEDLPPGSDLWVLRIDDDGRVADFVVGEVPGAVGSERGELVPWPPWSIASATVLKRPPSSPATACS